MARKPWLSRSPNTAVSALPERFSTTARKRVRARRRGRRRQLRASEKSLRNGIAKLLKFGLTLPIEGSKESNDERQRWSAWFAGAAGCFGDFSGSGYTTPAASELFGADKLYSGSYGSQHSSQPVAPGNGGARCAHGQSRSRATGIGEWHLPGKRRRCRRCISPTDDDEIAGRSCLLAAFLRFP